jgi:penicillin-binding protein 1C
MSRWRLILGGALFAGVVLVAVDRMFPPDLSRYRTASLELHDAGGETINVSLSVDGMWRLATAPDDVSSRYLDLLIAKEDRRYWRHVGVDPIALARALWQLASHGHVVSGGSTLTMQVARLLMPHRRDAPDKLIEIARALQLEERFSKREILAMYLTLAPFGSNIEGVRAASLVYFGHEPRRLSDAEAALLVALPQNPTLLRPDRYPDRAGIAARRVLEHAGVPIADISFTPVARHALPSLAPHLAERFAGLSGSVVTTLDGRLQSAVCDLISREWPWLGGPASISALVVHNHDRAVLAHIGGADYFGVGGMVDLVRSRRSPGSVLKPFIYGMAFDDALIAPDTLIEDVPLRIGDYAPQNFDRDFHGTVTAREALQQSYNLPAIEVLNGIGPARFAAALAQSGVHIVLPRGTKAPGLPIALGGLAISLEDLAKLYVSLADDGRIGPLRLRADDPFERGSALMTAQAAHEIGDILRETPRPDGLAPARTHVVAYKTGTSYGFRDAWAIGYTDTFTVAVWVGRIEGTPRPGAFGRNTAAPFVFKIFDLLPEEPVQSASSGLASANLIAPALRRYMPQSGMSHLVQAAAPRKVYPPPDATIDISGGDGSTPAIALEASGGRAPYRWAVNGVPLPKPPIGGVVSWAPDGPGFAQISVTDRNNRSASEQIRLE